MNTYGYVGGNPVSFIDPRGLSRKNRGKGRPEDPNGAFCKRLKRTINNLIAKIAQRKAAIITNPKGLPVLPPSSDSLPRDSVLGHMDLIKDDEESLKERINTYNERCGGTPPPAPADACGDTCTEKVATIVVASGAAYIAYRCVRMIPSLFPALWPTIPANALAP